MKIGKMCINCDDGYFDCYYDNDPVCFECFDKLIKENGK